VWKRREEFKFTYTFDNAIKAHGDGENHASKIYCILNLLAKLNAPPR
jgi:hypothetical protein